MHAAQSKVVVAIISIARYVQLGRSTLFDYTPFD